jgi:L-amino acid N-acyltransferase YncA
MSRFFLQAARDLGYKSSYFNLVFRSNEASVILYQSLGFERVSILEEAARLSGLEGLDTAYGYRFDLTTLPPDYIFQDTK